MPFCAVKVPPFACTRPVFAINGMIVPNPLMVPALEKLGAVKVPPCIARVAPEVLVTAPSAVRLPPKVKLPLLPTVVVTVKVVPPVFVSAWLGLIVKLLIVALLLSVTLPLLVLPIITSEVTTGGPVGVHLVVSVVQFPVASIQVMV